MAPLSDLSPCRCCGFEFIPDIPVCPCCGFPRLSGEGGVREPLRPSEGPLAPQEEAVLV